MLIYADNNYYFERGFRYKNALDILCDFFYQWRAHVELLTYSFLRDWGLSAH